MPNVTEMQMDLAGKITFELDNGTTKIVDLANLGSGGGGGGPVTANDITDAGTSGKDVLRASTPSAVKTVLALVKADVGLVNADNTSDASKPVSTAQQAALNLKVDVPGVVSTVAPLLLRQPLKLGFAGDSIASMWASTTGFSPVFWAKTELYPCDIVVTMNTAAPGLSSSHLVSNQIAILEALATKPDVVIIQSLQNDFAGSAANAESLFANVRTYSERALAAGVKLVVICSHPPKSSVPDVAAAVGHLNRLIENYCLNTPGNFYCDVMGAWRAKGVADTNGIAWQGTANTVDAYSDDGTHPGVLAARAAAPLIEPVLRRYARPISPVPFAVVAYDNTNYPYGNVLGLQGAMVGTGGQYNGVDNTNVPGASATVRNRWEVTDGNGVTATPLIVTGSDGYRYLQLTLSGTATANGSVTAATSFAYIVTSADYFAELVTECQNLTGITGVRADFQAIQTMDLAGSGNSVLTLNGRQHWRTPIINYSSTQFSLKTNQIVINFKSGQTVSGVIRIGRVGIHRVAP
jgi:lysophospholipase L1-like esterase